MYAPIPGTRVIGFGGAARAGKDTAANVLREIDPMRTTCFAFSDAISAYARVAGGMKKRDPRLLQEVGYAMRQAAPGVWLDALYWRIDEVRPRLALVTGVRFPDEVAMLRAMGGTLIWVDRVTGDGLPVMVTDRNPNHPVETAVRPADFDFRIVNPDGEEGLYRQRVLTLYEALTRVDA